MDLPIALGTVPAAQAATLPTEGAQGHFSPGDPTQNQYPTDVTAYWCESVTMEMLNVQAGCGVVADGTKMNQVWTGLNGYFAPILSPVFLVGATAPVLNSTTLNVSGAAALGSVSVYGPVVGTGSAQFAGALSAGSVSASGPVAAGGSLSGANVVLPAPTASAIQIGTPGAGEAATIYASLPSSYGFFLIQCKIGGGDRFHVMGTGDVYAAGTVGAGGLQINGSGNVSGAFTSASISCAGAASFGSLALYGPLNSTGAAQFGGSVSATGFSCPGPINAGTLSTYAYVAAGSYLTVGTDANIGGNVYISGSEALKGTISIGNGLDPFSGDANSGYNPIFSSVNGVFLGVGGLSICNLSSPPLGLMTTAAGGSLIQFYGNGGATGAIVNNNSSVTYSQTSDHRLKTDVEPIDPAVALANLEGLRPVTYRWKVEPDAQPTRGFIAHEFGAVYPAALTGEKDAVDDSGKIIPQMIDQTRVIPDLVAAVLRLAARVQLLEEKLA